MYEDHISNQIPSQLEFIKLLNHFIYTLILASYRWKGRGGGLRRNFNQITISKAKNHSYNKRIGQKMTFLQQK